MSCRLDFKQGNGTQVTDRTFPGILSGKMSEGDWTAFCDQIDVATKPIGEMVKKMRRNLLILIAIWLILSGIVINLFIKAEDWPEFFDDPFSTIIALFAVSIYSFRRQLREMQMKGITIEEEVMALLADETNKRTDVSFHLKKPANAHTYIECSVGAPGTGTGTGEGSYADASTVEQGFATAASSAQPAPAPSAAPSTSIFSSLAGSYA